MLKNVLVLTSKPIILVTLLALAACETPNAASDVELPNTETVRHVAENAYFGQAQRAPRDLRVDSVQVVNVLARSRYDVVACISAAEVQETASYASDGSVAVPAGSEFRQDHILLMRHYDDGVGTLVDGWGAGVFRQVHQTTLIGNTPTTSICGR